MKNFKRVLSIVTALSVMLVTFSFLGVVSSVSAATVPEGYEIDEQITIDFNTANKGWSGTNGTIGTNLTQVTDGTNKYMKLYTNNGNGYNFELANGSNSTTAYKMVGSTKYSVQFKVKLVSSSNADNTLSINFGTKAGYDPNLSKPYMKSFSASSLSTTEWTTLSYEFTTTATMAANTYDSTAKSNICDRLYFVAHGGGAAASYYIDDVVITKYKVASPKNQITYIHFNTEGKGWSDKTNASYLKQVADPNNSANKYMELSTPNGEGYNMELASGSNSSTAFVMEGNTKYTLTFKYKALDSIDSNLALYFGSISAYAGSNPKYGPVKEWFAPSVSDGEWHTATYEWTTTASMTYASYNGSGSTALCDNLYLVARGNKNTWAIDDVQIKKHVDGATGDMYVDDIKPEVSIPDVTHKITFNTKGMGYSDYTHKYDTTGIFNHVVDGSNGYIDLGTHNGNGFNIELAAGDNTTAFTMESNTTYTFTVKFKVITASDGALSINFGTQSRYNGSLAKPYMKTWSAKDYNDEQWHTVSYTVTTTETMAANTYDKSSTKTNICNKAYLVAHGGGNTGCEYYIDEVTIKKHGTGGTSGGDTTEPEEEKKVYAIPDFTHEPYKTYAAPGKNPDTWYCSLRWSTYTDNSNSVIRYKYAYDIAENAPSSSGNRGVNAMGTNGSTPAAMCLVPTATPNTPITVVQGKSYKITFKYKVLDIEPNSYVSFNIMRGGYSAGWSDSVGIGSATDKHDDSYIIAIEFAPTDDWVEASYTFIANFTTDLTTNKMQIGGSGYGDALIDDIVVQEINATEVVPPTNDASDYIYMTEGSNTVITSYKAKKADLTIKTLIGHKPLIRIGEYAFLYNRYAKNVTIQNGPTVIDQYAFEYAKVLETISIPKSITTIGKGAFYGIKTMKAFTVDTNNPNFAAVDGVLYTKDMKTLLYYPAAKDATTFTVPATVTTIAEGAFLNATKLQSIVLPEGLTTIERRAFMNCTALTAINLPSSLATIGSSAFRGCEKLSANNITVPEDITLGENPFADSLLAKPGNIDNEDNIVDLKDATALVRNLAGWQNSEFNALKAESADINDDGHVDLLDAVILQRHLAGWQGYENLPYTGETDYTYAEYSSDSSIPELVVNLTEKNSNKVVSNRDIAYDENKEDVIIILITGQSNSGTNGYMQEYGYKYTTEYNGVTHPDWEITAEPTRPEPNTVFFGATVTKLDSSTDVYTKTDPSKGTSTMGGYSPAMGKALHDATGAKIVFVQASKGAVGMHEWTPEPEKYECPCGENGGGVLYSQAIANFTKTYQALEDDYNIIATAYVYNQGEHEEYTPYVTSDATVHNDEGYYNALMEMHNGFLSECEIDCGGMYMPRSWYNRYTGTEPGLTDIEQNSRRPSIARAAQYAAAQNVENFFIFSNISETISKNGALKPDPTNSIHYSQGAYNAIGAQNADSVAKYFGFTEASEFEGIKVFNKKGVELCAFDKDGKLVSGSDVVNFSADNSKLYIRIDPTGTMYTLNYSTAGTSADFVDEYGYVTTVDGQTSFRIVINTPVK